MGNGGDCMSAVRETIITLKYDGKDISADVEKYLTAFTYVDKTISEQTDEISVTFQDMEGLWRGGWFPEQSASLSASIECRNWFKPGETLHRDCGSFEIDDITMEGPASVCSISAVAVGITNSIRRQENTKPWENSTIQAMLSEIAGKHGFALKWYSSYNPTIDRYDQKSESDMAFAYRICNYAGLTLKMTDKQMVVFRGEEFDAKPAELTIRRGIDGLSHWQFNTNSADVYTACQVTYYDPVKNELVEYLYVPDGISGTKGQQGNTDSGGERKIDPVTRMPVTAAAKTTSAAQEIKEPSIGQVLKVNQRCKSLAEAEKLAKAALRKKNMRHAKTTLDFMGNIKLYSGMNFLIEDFGRWDSATWQAESVTHNYSKSAGLKTSVDARGILSGY
jgi:phage protein D